MHRPLQWSAVAPAGPLARLGREFLHFEDLDSTNTHLLRRAAELGLEVRDDAAEHERRVTQALHELEADDGRAALPSAT